MTNQEMHEAMKKHQGCDSIIIDAGGENFETYILTCLTCDEVLFSISPQWVIEGPTHG